MNSIHTLRQLGAKYWKHFVSLVAVFAPVVTFVNDITDGSPKLRTWLIIAGGILLLIVIRFPRVAVAITRFILGPPRSPSDLPTIFRGPRPYNAEDKDTFPGRHKEIIDCWRLIQGHPFFVIDGESGCGKSSIINAALLPEANEKYNVIECRIADDPFGKLYAALRREPYHKEAPEVSREALVNAIANPAGSRESGAQNEPKTGKPLLVCIDQFEELFSTVKDETRLRFLEALKDSIRDGRMRLIIALRSDFLDLLMKLCDSVDPDREAVNLGNYYTLRAFRKDQAEEVLNVMLAPIHSNSEDPVLKQQIDDFAKALVNELLRPPRDKRLSRYDEKTVLPVELQTVGMMIESRGLRSFSVTELKQMGGKLGLLRAYIEEAKDYVWRKTAVSGDKALLILRHLISPAQTKWAQSPLSTSAALNLSPIQVKRVLDAFADKYLVKPLPIASEPDGATALTQAQGHEQQYELMHEHLVQILVEAPDPILQRARDAEERLRFWNERTKAATRPVSDNKEQRNRSRLSSLFAQPVPLVESLRLWRFARKGDERRIVKRSILGFFVRVGAVILPLLLAFGGWQLWTRTVTYQIRRIFSDAPVIEVASGSSDFDERFRSVNVYITLAAWTEALVYMGKPDEVIAAVRKLNNEAQQGALASIAIGLANADKFEEAIALGREIRDGDHHSRALRSVSLALCEDDKIKEALALASEIRDVDTQAYITTAIVRKLIIDGKVDEALSIWRNKKDDYYKHFVTIAVAKTLIKVGKVSEALAVTGEAMSQENISRALYKIVNSLIQIDRIDEAIATAQRIKEEGDKNGAIAAIAGRLAQKGKASEARSILSKTTVHPTYALPDIATGLAQAGRIDESLATAQEFMEDGSLSDEFVTIAEYIAEKGETEKALAFARRIGNEAVQADALVSVAKGLTRAGRLNEALDIARQIDPQQYSRNEAFTGISKELAKSGRVAEALTVVQEIDGIGTRSDALFSIVGELITIDRTDEALAIAREISDESYRYSALAAVAAALIEAGNTSAADAVEAEALICASEIKNESSRSSSFYSSALRLARLGSFRLARLTADRCLTSTEKLSAYATILIEYAKQKDPKLKARLEDKEAKRKKYRDEDADY